METAMADKSKTEAFEQYKSDFADRLTDAIEHSYGGDKPAKKDFEKRVISQIGKENDVFRRWYKGINLPDAFVISVIAKELQADGRTGYDAEYLLLGDHPTERDRKMTVHLLDTINELRDDVHSVRNYLHNHELGVEGVIMRQTMRMLQHINDTKITQQQGSKLDRKDEDTRHDEPYVAGYLSDDLIEIIAPHATLTRILATHLDDGSDTENQRTRPWRFQNLTSRCLALGCEYEFILHGPQSRLKDLVGGYRAAIAHTRPSEAPKYRKRLKFRATPLPIGAAYLLQTLDIESFQRDHPSFFAELKKHYILTTEPKKKTESPVHTLGIVMSHSTRTHGGFLMDRRRAQNALDTYARYKRDSKAIEILADQETD